MKEFLARLAGWVGLGVLLRYLNRKKLLVVMYHGVVSEALEPFCWHQLPLPAFARQIAWLRRRYRVLPLDLALALRAKGRLPPRSAVITFDDGYENVASIAAPLLVADGLPATVFLVTDLVGTERLTWPDRLWLAVARTQRREVEVEELGTFDVATPEGKASMLEATLEALKALPRAKKDAQLESIIGGLGVSGDADDRADARPFEVMDWETVSRLEAEGLVRVGPHSTTHEILSRCEDEEVERQVADSCAVVAERTGRPVSVFAYPNGRPQDFDARTRAAVEQAGVAYALGTVEGLVGEDADPLALPRVCVGADLSFARFRLLCAGR